MPELPEVETVVRGLAPHLRNAVAGEAWTDWPRLYGGLSSEDFNQRIQGLKFGDCHRRGKYICIALGHLYLVVHLRMTGRLYVSRHARGEDAWVHFSLELGDGRYLIFSDARKFGRVELTASLDFLEEKLGPEPLGLEIQTFRRIFTKSKRSIKAFLLDQKQLAGVGNIYADEALFDAGIHPKRPVLRLRVAERESLGKAVQKVLQKAIDFEGASISWYRKPDGNQGESQKHFLVYGRSGEPCLRCGTAITKIVLAQRGTHFCHQCQK